MKKAEKEFLEMYSESLGIEPESSKSPAKPASNYGNWRLWGMILGGVSCCAITLAIVLPNALGGNEDHPLNSGSVPNTPILHETTYLRDTAVVSNKNLLPRQYESNLSFVEDGIEVKYLDESGKPVAVGATQVDSSEFKEGVPGNYSIRASARRTDESGETVDSAFEVEVIKEEVTGLTVTFQKGCYYVGETPLSSDFDVVKTRVYDGERTYVAAKSSEIGLDLSAYVNEPGTYTIGVYLKGNEEIRRDVEVEVKPLSEIVLDGFYAVEVDEFSFGLPLVRGFTIEGNLIHGEYSEFVREAEFETLFHEDGTVEMDVVRSSQGYYYDPSTRVITVDGIAGDPEMHCYLMSESTAYVDVYSPVFENGYTYCAPGGYLNDETYNYVAYLAEETFQGGLYLDADLTERVGPDTHFVTSTDTVTTIYMGNPEGGENVGLAALLEGIYIDTENGYPYEEYCRFVDGELLFRNHNMGTAYGIYQSGGEIIVSFGYSTLHYDLKEGTLTYYDIEAGPLTVYQKVTDDLVEVNLQSSMSGGRISYFINRGESFPEYGIYDDGDEIRYFHIDFYDGSPITESTRFDYCQVGYNNLSMDYDGNYSLNGGTPYLDYLTITSASFFDRGAPNATYCLGVYENLVLVDCGEARIVSYDSEANTIDIEVDFDTAGKTRMSLERSSLVISYGESTYVHNSSRYKDVPFVGEYLSEDGTELTLTESGAIYIPRVNPETDYHYVESHGFYLVSCNDDLSEIVWRWAYYPDPNDWPFLWAEETLRRGEDGLYVLTFDGETFVQQVEE